jgi:hypothetical protein
MIDMGEVWVGVGVNGFEEVVFWGKLLIGVKIGEMMVRQVGIKGGEGSKVDGF